MLVDCPPSLGVLTINALAAASRLLVVPEPSSLPSRESTNCGHLRARSEALQPRAGARGVIVNRWERTVEHRSSIAEIERYFGEGVGGADSSKRTEFVQDVERRSVSRWCQLMDMPLATSRARSASLPAGSRRRWRPLSPARRSAATRRRPHPGCTAGREHGHDLGRDIEQRGSQRPRGDAVLRRVAESLRKRVEHAVCYSGRPVQEFVGDALDAECQRLGL